jgi:hypothetical protein
MAVMERAIYLTCCLFLAVGLACLGLAIHFVRDTQAFVERAVTVRGEVVDLAWVSDTYHPVVKYTTNSLTFRSSTGSSPPNHRVGEIVDVRYDRASPRDARLASFWSLWGFEIIAAAIGAVFVLLSGRILAVRLLTARRARYLRRHGTPIATEFQNVEMNDSFVVDGRLPWRIASRWVDPVRGALYHYHSEDLWFDPTPYIKTKHVTVFIDPNNPKRYAMDVSFLPKLAN